MDRITTALVITLLRIFIALTLTATVLWLILTIGTSFGAYGIAALLGVLVFIVMFLSALDDLP